MTLPNLTALSVTQIPLDNQTISRELIVSSARPPWIRPARKKNLSAPRSTGGVESPLQDAPELTGNTEPISVAPPSTPFSPATGIFPVTPTRSQPEFSVGTGSPSEQLNPAGAGSGVGNLELPLPSADLMALFEDGGLDVTGLFPQSALGCTMDRPSDKSYGEAPARRRSQASGDMAGLVASP
jgi:hypothetical protein